jgi:hypothetical protein
MNSYTKVLCIKCNEFYGSEERQGMCSVCFKKIKPIEESKAESTIETQPAEVLEAVKEPEMKLESTKPVQTNMMNCWVCNVKVGYLGFKCHCEYVFCGKHRHFSEHNCDFDYKNYDRSKLKAAAEGKKVK